MEFVWLFVVVGIAFGITFTVEKYLRKVPDITPATLDAATHQQLVEKAGEWWRVASDQHSVIEHILAEDRDGVYVISDANRIAAGRTIDRFNHATQGGK